MATPVSEEQSPLVPTLLQQPHLAKGRQRSNGNKTLAPNGISLAPTTVPVGSAPRQSFNTAVRTSCTETEFIHTFHQTLVVEKGGYNNLRGNNPQTCRRHRCVGNRCQLRRRFEFFGMFWRGRQRLGHPDVLVTRMKDARFN